MYTIKVNLLNNDLKIAIIRFSEVIFVDIFNWECKFIDSVSMFLYAQEEFQDIGFRSNALAVAAFDFGHTYSGYAFSWRSKWNDVLVNLPQNKGYMQIKAPPTLLLNPDQSFCAFGYDAENIFSDMELRDSKSDDETANFNKQNCSNYYYFKKLTKFLHNENVSQLIMTFQSVNIHV